MATVNLTDNLLRSLKTNKTQEFFWDKSFPGSFGVRVTKGGSKAFVLRYRLDGRRRSPALGRYPVLSLKDAKEMALEALRRASRGKDLETSEWLADDCDDGFTRWCRQSLHESEFERKLLWDEGFRFYPKFKLGLKIIDEVVDDSVCETWSSNHRRGVFFLREDHYGQHEAHIIGNHSDFSLEEAREVAFNLVIKSDKMSRLIKVQNGDNGDGRSQGRQRLKNIRLEMCMGSHEFAELLTVLGGYYEVYSYEVVGLWESGLLRPTARALYFAELLWEFHKAEMGLCHTLNFPSPQPLDVVRKIPSDFLARGWEVALMVTKLMEDREEWVGDMTSLLRKLEELAKGNGINAKGRYWPKAPNELSKKLNKVSTNLAAVGIEIERGKTRLKRTITIRNTRFRKDEEVYVGDLKNGKRHGQGTLTYPDGEVYVGEFRDGHEHGQGTLTLANGEVYVLDGYKRAKKTRGLFKREGSDNWQMRFADEQGRVVRDSTGTTNQKLARKILDKKRVQVVAKKNLSGEILDEFLESDDNIGEIGA